ncbi:MAG: sulfatase, partial [Planctomycetota bacterium]
MRNPLRLFTTLFLLTSFVPLTLAEPKPNIVLIYTDDHGWNGTSARMHPDLAESRSDYYRTPNIERLAREGVRFSRGYAPNSNCSPSRHAILSGMSPAKNRRVDIGSGRGPREHVRWLAARNSADPWNKITTFPRLLRDHAGYATAHFGKWHLPQDPSHVGFETHDGSRGNAAGGGFKDPKFIFQISNRGVEFIRKQTAADRPFYLQISHFATHLPIQYRNATYRKYKNLPPGARHRNPGYAAMTEDLDTGVGLVLDALDELGIADNTYVVYTADNGALRGENNEFTNNDPLNFGKPQDWEGGIRVPFIVRGPGVAPNSWRHQPYVGYDLFPTFCNIAGIGDRVPDGVEGGSLLPTLHAKNEVAVQRPNPYLVFHFPNYVLGYKDTRPQSAIMMGDLKLMKLYEWDRPRLFNLRDDIGETTDLWDTLPEKAQYLHDTLNAYLQAVNAPMPTHNPDWTMTPNQWLE